MSFGEGSAIIAVVWLFGQRVWPWETGQRGGTERCRSRLEVVCRIRRGVGQGWVCCDGVTLESQRGACLQRPSPQPLDHCQHESVTEGWRLEWGGDAVRGGGSETSAARSSVHVRSTGDLGSWTGDICSTSGQATSAKRTNNPPPPDNFSLKTVFMCNRRFSKPTQIPLPMPPFFPPSLTFSWFLLCRNNSAQGCCNGRLQA